MTKHKKVVWGGGLAGFLLSCIAVIAVTKVIFDQSHAFFLIFSRQNSNLSSRKDTFLNANSYFYFY
jgi:hypothetical protein